MRTQTLPIIQTVLFTFLMVVFFHVNAWADFHKKANDSQVDFATIWDTVKLYSDKDNPYIQSFSLVGRYHGQYWIADSENNRAEKWENRRMYFGFNSKFSQQFTLEIQANLNDDLNPVYKGLYDAFVKWETPDKDFAGSVGRLDYVFTGMERSTSSKKIKTMERALLVNQIMPGEVFGLYLEGKLDHFSYQTGLFSGSIEDELTDFKGGFGALVGVAHNAPLYYDKGTIHLDYLYNNGNTDNNAFKPYKHIVSLWHQGQKGNLGVDLDITTATGTEGKSDLFGITILPTYDFARNLILSGDKIQLAMRYHHASSSDASGLVFNKRYEQKVAVGKGDSYNSYYIGLNYYIYMQKLKLMTGFEYFDMDGVTADTDTSLSSSNESIHGWNFISGIRLYF